MFDSRGYTFLESDDERIVACKEDGKLVCAFVPKIATKFNNEKFEAVCNMLKQLEIQHVVVVYKNGATSMAKKNTEVCVDIEFELFTEEELQYNLTTHVLVPHHELACRKGTPEALEFKKRYGDKIPVILKTDAVARFYYFRPGDIVKVTRPSGLVVYRKCV